MVLSISSRTVDVSYRGESPTGTASDYEIVYPDPEPANAVRLDKDTLARYSIAPLQVGTDWAINLDHNYTTSSGVEGTYDYSDATAAYLYLYDYRSGSKIATRSSEQYCTISGSQQVEIDSTTTGRVIIRWSSQDINPAPVGNYKFSLNITRPEGIEQACSGFLTVIL